MDILGVCTRDTMQLSFDGERKKEKKCSQEKDEWPEPTTKTRVDKIVNSLKEN